MNTVTCRRGHSGPLPPSRSSPRRPWPACLALTVQTLQVDGLVGMRGNPRTDLRRRLPLLRHAIGVDTLLRTRAALHAMRAGKTALQAGMPQRPIAVAVARQLI